MPKELHRVLMEIPKESLLDYFIGRRALTNVPADAMIRTLDVISDWRDGVESNIRIRLGLEHPSFPLTEGTNKIPRIRGLYRLAK